MEADVPGHLDLHPFDTKRLARYHLYPPSGFSRPSQGNLLVTSQSSIQTTFESKTIPRSMEKSAQQTIVSDRKTQSTSLGAAMQTVNYGLRNILITELECMQRQLTDVLVAAQPLSDTRETIQAHVEKTQQTLASLMNRSERDRVSVLFTGTTNAGKSTLINALLGNVVCAHGNEATTTNTVTIAGHPGEQYQLLIKSSGSQDQSLELSEQCLLLEATEVTSINRKLREISAATRREGGNQDPWTDKDLVLQVPELTMAQIGGDTLGFVDSPGSNEALSPYLNDQWASAIVSSDIVVAVVAYRQLESKDVATFWQRYALELPSDAPTQNLLVVINKFDQVDPSDAFTDVGDKIEGTRCRFVQLVRDSTNGKVNLRPEQVFIGSARDALVSQVANDLDDELPDKKSRQEYGELSALAGCVFGSRRKPQPTNATASKCLEDWQFVYEESGIDEFVDSFSAKAQSAEVAHVFKLTAAVDATASEIISSFATYESNLRKEVSERTNAVKQLHDVNEKVDQCFMNETESEGTIAEMECRRLLMEWLDDMKTEVMEALEVVSTAIATEFDAVDEKQLSYVVASFEEAAQNGMQRAEERYKPSIAALMEHHWESVQNCEQQARQLLADSSLVPTFPREHSHTSGCDPDALSELCVWISNAMRWDNDEIAAQLKSITHQRCSSRFAYRSEIDFTRSLNKRQINGSFYHDSADCHAKLGHGPRTLTAAFRVNERFHGHKFVLELIHLRSYGGSSESSRAPVTILVNGHTVNESFCSSVDHGGDGNGDGDYDFVHDRWELDPSIVQGGENTVELLYCLDSTTYYWLRSLCLQCTINSSTKTVIQTQDVKEFFKPSTATYLEGGLETQELPVRIQQVLTQPSSALENIRQYYNHQLNDLTEVRIRGLVKYKELAQALNHILSQCKDMSMRCQTMIAEVATLTTLTP